MNTLLSKLLLLSLVKYDLSIIQKRFHLTKINNLPMQHNSIQSKKRRTKIYSYRIE